MVFGLITGSTAVSAGTEDVIACVSVAKKVVTVIGNDQILACGAEGNVITLAVRVVVITAKVVVTVAAVSVPIATAVTLAAPFSKAIVLVQSTQLNSLPLPEKLIGQLLLLANGTEKPVRSVIVAEPVVRIVFGKLSDAPATVEVISVIAAIASAEDFNIFGGISWHGCHTGHASNGGHKDL